MSVITMIICFFFLNKSTSNIFSYDIMCKDDTSIIKLRINGNFKNEVTMHGIKWLFTFCNPADQTQYDACNGNIFNYLNKF